jgi:3-deoxy-D-manno-octulosonic-acid transferase
MSARGSLALRLYGALTGLAEPLAPTVLRRRLARGKEDPARVGERRGVPSLPRPEGRLVWLHAASVGETNTVLPLIRALLSRRFRVLLTTVTVTSARLAAERLPEGAFHQFVPLDAPGAVARFLDHWRPDLAVMVEQELWPNLIGAAKARGVPLALVNARMSPRSAARWARFAPKTARALLSAFDATLAQSAGDAERLSALGARGVEAPGNLKFDTPAPPADPALLAALMAGLGGRPAWVAASTQPGEEEFVFDAHLSVRTRVPGSVLLIAPRHPTRGDAVEALAGARGLLLARRSRGEWPGPDTPVFLLDTIGELGLVYRAGRVAFLGGSLVPHGGQNPIEPGKLGLPVLSGPGVHNFEEVYAAMRASGGARECADAVDLADQIAALLADKDEARRRGAAAAETVAALGGGLARTEAALLALVAPAATP